jgi:multiple antibiotic resistance protein
MFVVRDPLGDVPTSLALSSNRDAWGRARAATQAMLAAFVLILKLAPAGWAVLDHLKVSMPALSVTGGLLLAGVAVERVFAGARDRIRTFA